MAADSHQWPLWWRIIILINISVFTTLGNFYSAGLGPLLRVFAEQFHKSTSDASHLLTYAVLTIGLSNLLALPISHFIGKRYTILTSMLLFMGVNIWSSYCTSFDELIASRLIGGLAAGIVEALGPMIVVECFERAQLATAMAVYSLSLGFGAGIGPVVAGLVYDKTHTWPWFFKTLTIIIGVNLLSSILMLPETTGGNNFENEALTPNPGEVVDAEKAVSEEVEKVPRAVEPLDPENLYNIWMRRSFFWKLPDITPKASFSLFLQPLTLVMSPAVVLTAVIFGILIAFSVTSSIIYAAVLAQPPLLWTPLKVGLLNLSMVVGLIVGMPTGGYLADIFYRRSARRNDGTAVRESRFFAILPGSIISPLGAIVSGVCLQEHRHWVSYAFGWMMMGVGLTAIANVLLTYCVDCYPWRSTHIGVVVNVIKNMVSFGASYAAIPWYNDVGPQKQFGTLAGILIFFLLLTIPLHMYGDKMRSWSLKYIL